MTPGSLRIFVTTSHISTVYMTLLARSTHRENDIDLLLVDSGARRTEKIAQMQLTASFHEWSLFHNFSEIAPEVHDLRPGLLKRITRRIKTLPVFRAIYNVSFRKYMARVDAEYRERISELLIPFMQKTHSVQLYAMAQTYLNRPLRQLYPDAAFFYVEHGIGDYQHAIEKGKPLGEMYAVFAEPFRHYLDARGFASGWVKQLPGLDTFPAFAQAIMQRQEFKLEPPPVREKKNIFILMEAVDMYEVPASFWSAYLDHIFAQLEDPAQHHFLLKPHHLQSEISMRYTREHLDRLGYSYTILGDERIKSAAMEVIFSHWADSTEKVFFLFSSAGFYLSMLYPQQGIRYYYSTEFMSRYVDAAPEQYRRFFAGIRPLIDHVFAKNCEAF